MPTIPDEMWGQHMNDTRSELVDPVSLSIARDGTIWIADEGDHRVRQRSTQAAPRGGHSTRVAPRRPFHELVAVHL